jgi:raffinose/stachyose/melibiose transport system substrate-binding protein
MWNTRHSLVKVGLGIAVATSLAACGSSSGSSSGTSAASGTSASGTSAAGTSASGTSASGTSASGTSASGTSATSGTTAGTSGSSGALKGNITIEWSPATPGVTTDPFSSWLVQSMNLYKKAHPQVSFQVSDNLTSNNYLAKLDSQMAASTTPDVFVGWTEQRMIPYAKANRLLNLKPYLASDPSLSSALSKLVLSSVSYNGGVYGLPLTNDTEIMYYNKAVFAKYDLKPPTTYAQFLHIIAVLKSHGVPPIALDNAESWEGSILFTQLAERLGGVGLYDNVVVKGSVPFNNPTFSKVGTMIQSLVHAGAFNSDFLSQNDPYAQTIFEQGKAGMWDMGTWDIPTLYSAMKGNLGWFPFPSVPGGKGNGSNVGMIENTNNALSVSPVAQNKALAVNFLEFLFSSARQVPFAALGESIAESIPLTDSNTDPVDASIHNAMITAKSTMSAWDDALGTALGEKFDDATQEIYNGTSPSSAMSSVDQAKKELG